MKLTTTTARRTGAALILASGLVLTGCGAGQGCDDIAPTESVDLLADDDGCGEQDDD